MTTTENKPTSKPMWAEVKLTLSHPIETAEGMLSEITLREPDVEALERIDDLAMTEGQRLRVAQVRGIIAALSGQPDDVIKKLHKGDFAAIGEAAVPLLAEDQGEAKL